jgi:hypothetical protein
MAAGESVTVESSWLPPEELRRLLDQSRSSFPDVAVSVPSPERRGVDPQVAVAVISAVSTLLVPFVTLVAARLFAKEPKAALKLDGGDDGQVPDVVIRASLPEGQRQAAIDAAIASGATRVKITLELTLD